MTIESMLMEIREPPNLGNSKVVCGHCHHRGHRNNITKPCELKKWTERKASWVFQQTQQLKAELNKKKTTLKEIESQKIKSMEDFSTCSEFSLVKNLTVEMYAANPAYKTNKAKLMCNVRILSTLQDGKIPCVSKSKKNLGTS